MSRPWIAFYMGDYLKKTQLLTTEQHGAYLLLLIECWSKGRIPELTKQNEHLTASICRVSLRRFRTKIAPILGQYFNADGTNKRATEEIEKADKFYEKRALAGRIGGYRSGQARRSKRSKLEANNEANAKQKSKQSSTNHNHNISSSLPSAARASAPAVDNSSATDTAAAAPKQPPRKEGKQKFGEGLTPGTIVGPEVLR